MIHPPYLAFYLESMRTNCELAFESIDLLNMEFGNFEKKTQKEIAQNAVINQVQNIVIQAGNLSKFFFPVTKKTIHQERGNELCSLLGIDSSSPLSNKTLRNAIEHLDERIDIYFQQPRSGFFFPCYVGFEPKDEERLGNFFRAYFVDTKKFRILSEEVEIIPLVEEINKCYERITAET